MDKKRTEDNLESVSVITARRLKISIAIIVLFFISGICAIYIYGAVTGIVCAFWICYLVITIIMIYRNTADAKDNLYEALDELDERYAEFEAQNRELKTQNKELLKKLNRIEAMLSAAEEPETENTETENTETENTEES